MSDRSESGPLIRGYRLEISEIPCLPGTASWDAIAVLEEPIGALLPYLNSELKGADYYHDRETLIWRNGGHKYAFRPHEISVAPVADREEALRLMGEMVATVDAIWKRRAEIAPSFGRRRLPGVMEIYKLLPRTNCKECGQPSCMAYCVQLREDKVSSSQCPYLAGDSYAALCNQPADG